MEKVKLGDVAIEKRETWTGSTQGVPIIGLEHLVPGEVTLSSWDSDTDNTFSKMFRKGQVLLGRRRVYLKKAVIAQFDGICSGDITVIEAIPGKISSRLLPFVIQNERFFDYAMQGSAGSLSPRVKWEHLKDYEFNLPDYEEQDCLADKLWSALKLRESYQSLLQATDEIVKSRFIEELYSRYPKQKLGEHISVIRGVSYKPSDVRSSNSETSTAIILRSNNITDGEINFDDLVFVVKERVKKEQELHKGDIVMCGSNGSISLVGKAGLLKTNRLNISFGAFCLGIKCKKTVLPEYLNTYFNTPVYREEIESMGNGTNIINIRPNNITNIMIPIPPSDKQKAFVDFVQQADKSKFELKQAIEKIDKVMRALMQ